MSPQYAFQSAPMNMPMFADGGLASAAKAVQSKGRGNDTMLVHMTPREVGGLQALAMAHGGKLTINPQTGLPEAGFLDAILPMIAGFALGPAGFALMSAPMAGLTVGGLTALATGDLGRGLMAGLGAFGGAGLGEAFAGGAGATAASPITPPAPPPVPSLAEVAAPGTIAPVSNATYAAGATPVQGLTAQYPATVMPDVVANPGVDFFRQTPEIVNTGAFDQGIGLNAMSDKIAPAPGFMDRYVTAMGGKTGATLGGVGMASPILEQMTPKYEFPTGTTDDYNYEGPYVPTERSVAFKPAGDTSTSEFQYFSPSNPIPGYQPRYVAEGGAIDADYNMEVGRNAAFSDRYALGGLTALAGGRYLKGPGDGTSDSIPATIADKQPARLADGEFVIDARTVSEIGNGSSNAGAKKLYNMMDRVHAARKKAKRGQDTKAERYMPA